MKFCQAIFFASRHLKSIRISKIGDLDPAKTTKNTCIQVVLNIGLTFML